MTDEQSFERIEDEEYITQHFIKSLHPNWKQKYENYHDLAVPDHCDYDTHWFDYQLKSHGEASMEPSFSSGKVTSVRCKWECHGSGNPFDKWHGQLVVHFYLKSKKKNIC